MIDLHQGFSGRELRRRAADADVAGGGAARRRDRAGPRRAAAGGARAVGRGAPARARLGAECASGSADERGGGGRRGDRSSRRRAARPRAGAARRGVRRARRRAARDALGRAARPRSSSSSWRWRRSGRVTTSPSCWPGWAWASRCARCSMRRACTRVDVVEASRRCSSGRRATSPGSTATRSRIRA